jgi:hypothetical protein
VVEAGDGAGGGGGAQCLVTIRDCRKWRRRGDPGVEEFRGDR